MYESTANDATQNEDSQPSIDEATASSFTAYQACEQQNATPTPGNLTFTASEPANRLEDPGLFDRVAALERMVNHLVEWSKSDYHQRVIGTQPAAFQASITSPSTHEDEDENNMFAARVLPDDLSLSSQLGAIRALLSKPSSPKPSSRQNSRSQILVEFPDPPTLQRLFHVFFSDFDSYFPFLDQNETEARIFTTLRRLGYSSNTCNLLVPNKDLSVISLTCLMLAMAECLDSEGGAVDADSKPGW